MSMGRRLSPRSAIMMHVMTRWYRPMNTIISESTQFSERFYLRLCRSIGVRPSSRRRIKAAAVQNVHKREISSSGVRIRSIPARLEQRSISVLSLAGLERHSLLEGSHYIRDQMRSTFRGADNNRITRCFPSFAARKFETTLLRDSNV